MVGEHFAIKQGHDTEICFFPALLLKLFLSYSSSLPLPGKDLSDTECLKQQTTALINQLRLFRETQNKVDIYALYLEVMHTLSFQIAYNLLI